jgi:hypothetical protein
MLKDTRGVTTVEKYVSSELDNYIRAAPGNLRRGGGGAEHRG